MRKCVLSGVAAVVAAVCVSGATADVVNISSNGLGLEGNGAYTGLISYVPGVLTVSLTNSNTSASGGKITAFVFNIAGSATAVLSGGTHPFADLGTSPSASPFGTFEGGAGMGGSWTGGGPANAGIHVGSTGTFTFTVTGADAGSLTASSFISSSGINFVTRFRGFDNGGSDKTPGFVVPAPGALAAFGVLAVAGRRRRVG